MCIIETELHLSAIGNVISKYAEKNFIININEEF